MGRISKNRAFSLVEIMFVIIVFGLLLGPIFSVFNSGSTGTIRNRNDILAQQHASNLLAYAYSLPYEHEFLNIAAPHEVNDLKIQAGSEELSLGMEEPIFHRTVEVSEIKPTDWKYAYKIVCVKVNWQQSNEQPHEIRVSGLIVK